MRFNTYQKLAITTVLATLFLILVGGLVRASGAGLGCPDWPQCWGTWLPPVDAGSIDATRYDISQFNSAKMWVEYINRLVGVTIGLLIVATFIASFRYRRTKPVVLYGSLLSLVLVLFQGWLGGVVVQSKLHGLMITLHLMLAILLVFVLLYTTFKATQDHMHTVIPQAWRRPLVIFTSVLLLATLAQIAVGSQVREALDAVARRLPDLARSQWINEVGFMDHVHRASSWVVLIAGAGLLVVARRSGLGGLAARSVQANLGLTLSQIALGACLAYMAIPPAAQVFHLFLASLLVSNQLLLILILTRTTAHGLNSGSDAPSL